MKRNPEFARHADRLAREWGIINTLAMDYMPEDREGAMLALDAQPTLISQPSSGVPAIYTTYIDPEVIRIFQTPNKGALILGEQKKGSWVDNTMMFPVIENTGEVSMYGDFNQNGRSSANPNFVQRQAARFQTVIEYGELEEETAGAARLNWVSELQVSGAATLDKFMDYVYHFGVAGMENYGLLNDPYLSAALTPGTKGLGGVKWINNGNPIATSNEVYNDILALYTELQAQAPGFFDEDTEFVLVLPSVSAPALAFTNTFGLTARGILEQSFKKVSIVVDPRYATAGGNVVQLIAKTINGRPTGYCAFSEKMRDHRVVPDLSSYKQKKTAASWGAVYRYPLAVAQMIGV